MSAPVNFDATHLSAPEAHRSSRASPWRPKAQGRSEMLRIGTVIEGARSCDNAAVAMRLMASAFRNASVKASTHPTELIVSSELVEDFSVQEPRCGFALMVAIDG
jgi:hypothetical protein